MILPGCVLLYRLLYLDFCFYVRVRAVLCRDKGKRKKPESLKNKGFLGLLALELIARFELATSSLPKA